MVGARGYRHLKSGQYGRLYICVGSHARGCTLRVFVMPEGVTVDRKSEWNAPHPDAVEVYGVTGGQTGWDESYGWTKRGPWEDDFRKIVSNRNAEIETQKQADRVAQEIKESANKARTEALLATYPAKGATP